MTDWLGWDSLSVAEQLRVLVCCLAFGAAGGGSVMFAYALFGIGPRHTRAKRRKRKRGRR